MSLDNPIRPSYAAVELEDGTTYSGVRITFADRRALERTMKAQGWNSTDNPFTISAFLAWHAGKRNGEHQVTNFAEFVDQLVDVELSQPEARPDDVDDEVSPTQPAAITG